MEGGGRGRTVSGSRLLPPSASAAPFPQLLYSTPSPCPPSSHSKRKSGRETRGHQPLVAWLVIPPVGDSLCLYS